MFTNLSKDLVMLGTKLDYPAIIRKLVRKVLEVVFREVSLILKSNFC